MRFLFIVLFMCMLVPTAAAANKLKVHKSTFDGSTEVTVEPGFIYSSKKFSSRGNFLLGLHWSSAAKNVVTITADVRGGFVNLYSEEGLQFNIDGEIIKLSSLSAMTDTEVSVYLGEVFKRSTKGYPVTLDFIRRLVAADDVKVKLVAQKGYLEGDFMAKKPGAAFKGFTKFLEKIDSFESVTEKSP